MLHDLNNFFGDVTPQGAVALLAAGLLSGFGLHDMIIWSYRTIVGWYAAKHGSHQRD